MKLRKVYQGVIPEHKILNSFSESQSDTYSCETINTMISEIDLSNAVVEETDPTVPQHVKNITEEDIAKWNSGTGSDGIEFNDAVRRKWTYTPTVATDPSAHGWVKVCSTVTTDVLPKGKYLILYRGTLGTYESASTAISSLTGGLDGTRLDNTTRNTLPLVYNLVSTGQVQYYVEFTEDKTHTLDMYQYANVRTYITATVIDVIRIGDIGGSEGILSLPVASKTELGTVKAGNYLRVDNDGTMHVALDGSDGTIITTNNNSRLRDGKYNVTAVNHRGYSTEAPENTLPAYIMSKEKGFNYVECDVSFTSDGVAVLLHDSTIDRTSNGTGSVSAMTYQQLLQYDFGSWKSSKFAGTKIPTFAEFIELCKNIGLHPYIELKSNGSYTKDQITQIVDLVKKNGMKGNVTYISFNKEYLEYVKQADRQARLGYLADVTQVTLESAQSLRTGLNEVYIGANYTSLTDEKVNMCIEANFPLEIWTVNDAAVIKNMNSYISGVTSDSLIAGRILFEDNDIEIEEVGGIVNETDPTVPEHVKSITVEDIARWEAGGEGNSKPEIAIQNDAPEDEDITLWLDLDETDQSVTDEVVMDTEFITVTTINSVIPNKEDTHIPYEKVVEDTTNGKLFLNANGDIEVGPGVNCVRVTAQVGIQNQVSGYDQKRLSLYVNGVKTQVSYAVAYTNQYSVGVPNIIRILSVKEGDVLSLYAGYVNVHCAVCREGFNEFTVEICDNRKTLINENHKYSHYYSYQEQFIGKWLDGKNLYEKTIYVENLDLTTEGYQYIPHYIENINQVIDFNYRNQSTPIVHGDDDFGDFSNEIYRHVLRSWAFNKKYIRLHNQAWDNIKDWYFTIQYTKKDEEGLD